MYPSHPASAERSKLLLFSILMAESIAYVMEVFIGIGEGNRIDPLIWWFSILFPLLGHLIFPLLYFLGLLFGIYKVSGADGWWAAR